MKNIMKQRFSTGKFAKLLNIKKDTLFYYEKIGLFCPAGTLENGYRYYTFDQFDQFMAIHSLRQAEVSIKTLKTYFDEPSPQKLQQLAITQRGNVLEEIEKLKNIQFFLERTIEVTEEITHHAIEQVQLQQLNAEPIVYSKACIDWTMTLEELYEQSTQFLKMLGIKATASYGVVYKHEDFLAETVHQRSRLFCRLSHTDADIRPAGTYAVIYYKGVYDAGKQAFERLNRYVEEHQLQMIGDIYEECLLHSIASIEEKDFVTKLSVQVARI